MRNYNESTSSTVEMVSFGCHVDGLCLPHVDTADPKTLMDGFLARMGRKLPDVDDPLYYRKMKSFVNRWCKANLVPLSPEHDLSFETWIEKTNYPLKRKEELRKIYEEVLNPLQLDSRGMKHFLVKLFAKDETYVEFKHARGIYARSDVAKCFFGPFFKAIEEVVYECTPFGDDSKPFIKHIPVADRAEYMYEMLYTEGATYIQTDYTSFESHFNAQLMNSCEFVMYRHMLSNCPGGPLGLSIMQKVLCGRNIIQNKNFFCQIMACRMSGEMNTSLGNGFFNLMMMLYVCEQLDLKTRGVVEGDDGLFTFVGRCPSKSDFTKLGCNIKLVPFERISEASFCGLLFDEQDKQIITDPLKVMVGFSWTTKQYARSKRNKLLGLMRCKALSFITQYPSCPIISSMSRYALRMTRGFDVRALAERKGLSLYDRERLLFGIDNWRSYSDRGVGIHTRELVFKMYGISVEQQLAIEAYFDAKTDLAPIDFADIYELCPESWKLYWDRYVVEIGQTEDIFAVILERPTCRQKIWT